MKHIEEVNRISDGKLDRYSALADRIWSFAEMRYVEHLSAELHATEIEGAGFRVTRGVADMPTAFMAQAGNGGPVIGFLGEYDALAGLTQESGVAQCRPDPSSENRNGHGCGHHLLGTAAHLAAVVTQEYLQAHDIQATVRFYGCPAEEAAAGKVFMARAGLFDDLDAALCWHPGVANSVFMNATLANVQAHFRFYGKSAHAALAPHLGRSALDAAELMNIGVNYLREHMPDLARVHYAYINSGGPSTNVIPAQAEVLYTVRAPQIGEAMELFERVRQVANGAAMMTGTRVEMVFDKAVSNVLHNDALDVILDANMRALGGFAVTEEETEFARTIQATLTSEDFANSTRHFASALRNPRPIITEVLPYVTTDRPVTGSTDVGDVSWAAPTTQCLSACYAWGTGFHSWQMVSQGKMSLAHKGMLFAAKTMAATAIDLIARPEVLRQAKAELAQKRGGRPYQCPIPADVQPPPARSA
jgi:aminobenzoyl-glutamate utilization protein B